MKALTEKLYWVPGTRLDSTIIVVLSVVFTSSFPLGDDCCSSLNWIIPMGYSGESHVSVMLSFRTPPGT